MKRKSTNKQSVLIVDDEPEICDVFKMALEIEGFQVMSTTSGTEAIELVRTKEFDVILLDIFMRDITGFEVLDKVRAFSQIPVVVFTARPDIFDMALRLGASGFIAKPLNPATLVTKVREILAKSD
jgi:CheY-like chemotaxis protein